MSTAESSLPTPQKSVRTMASLGALKESPRPSYFDMYPARATPRPKSAKPQLPTPRTTKTEPPPTLVAFPSVEPEDEYIEPATPRKAAPTSRIRAWSNNLRYSGSTLDTGTLTPPRTPSASFSENVLVAAPVSGVETMDALVDGMDSHGDADFISAMRRKASPIKYSPYHPLYQPPLPTPPRGITLGGAIPRASTSTSSSDEERSERRRRKQLKVKKQQQQHHHQQQRPIVLRASSDSTIKRSMAVSNIVKQARVAPPPVLDDDDEPDEPLMSTSQTMDEIIKKMLVRGDNKPEPTSIDDIIRAHAPQTTKTNTRSSTAKPSTSRPSTSRSGTARPRSSPPAPTFSATPEEEDGISTSRSSVDSITMEIMGAMKKTPALSLHHAKSFPNRPPTADMQRRNSSLSEHSQSTHHSTHRTSSYARSEDPHGSYDGRSTPSTVMFASPYSVPPPTSGQAIARYLKSPRLTRLVTLQRQPYRGMTVSLADVGSPTGVPVLVFLGLGCVRYLVALYDEMAEALGLRLICIDRWGLGKTDDLGADACEKRGVREWAGVCEEVLDKMGIQEVAVMAHSAGAPYALAFSLRMGPRALGSIHLLAPWVGGDVEGAGYKWLKYVPNTLIKTAQAAEWKVHGWRLGKPPTIAYEGIAYDHKAPISNESPVYELGPDSLFPPQQDSRISFSASDYDDLADFGGRFASSSTLASRAPAPAKRKQAKSLFGKWKTTNGSPSPVTADPAPSASPNIRAASSSIKSPKLKGLRSMSSLKGSSSSVKGTPPRPALLPDVGDAGFGLGFNVEFGLDQNELSVTKNKGSSLGGRGRHDHANLPRSDSPPPPSLAATFPRATRRSISLTSTSAPTSSTSAHLSPRPAIPHHSSSAGGSPSPSISGNGTPQVSNLANALVRASHHEAQRGQTGDLLAILERDSRPWGFSYTDVRHQVKVWYGDKDEKIGEGAIRWMERIMKDCVVIICKGQDHGLMANAAVVVEVLESIEREALRRKGHPY